MVSPNQFDTGMAIYVEGDLCLIENYQHSKQARGGAIIKVTLRNLDRGGELQKKRLRSDEDYKQAIIREKPAQFLYEDGNFLVFMDMETYDQVELAADSLGDKRDFLSENMKLELKYCDGEPIGIELPDHVNLEVKETSPGVKGNTAQGGAKPATLTSGLTVNVPLFINEGETITVNTNSGEYVGRSDS